MFTCKRIDRQNADGSLGATGVEWTEHREWISYTLVAFTSLCAWLSIFTLTGVALMAGSAGGSGPWWIPAAMTVALWSPLFWYNRVQFPGTPRQLIFERDGTMPAPLGFALYAAWVRSVEGHHAHIASIEARQTATHAEARSTAYTHGVAIIKRSGDIVYVAKHLHPDHAMKVAVQLTQALNDMREALTNANELNSGGRKVGAASSAKPRVNVLID